MPTYRYKCPVCKAEQEAFNWIRNRNKGPICKCGSKTNITFHGCSLVEVWKPITLEHIAPDPMTFNSKRDLQDYCREHKLTSGALL